MRYMALDLGDHYIGIALSDENGMIARPLKVIKRTSRVNDYAIYNQLIAEYHVQAVIAGLPVNMDGSEGKQAHWVRDYMAAFSNVTEISVSFWDERLTSEIASEIMKENNKYSANTRVDAVAAAVILQSYLDNQPR